jgi:hypothetical protein
MDRRANRTVLNQFRRDGHRVVRANRGGAGANERSLLASRPRAASLT